MFLFKLFKPLAVRHRAPRAAAEVREEGARVRRQDAGEGGHDADAQQDEREAGEGEHRAQECQAASGRAHRPAARAQHRTSSPE